MLSFLSMVFKNDAKPTLVKRQSAMKKKINVSHFLQMYRTVKAIRLDRQKTVTVNWNIIKCLPEIL